MRAIMQKSTHTSIKKTSLRSKQILTPLGSMLAIADNQSLYLLAFEDRENLATDISLLEKKLGAIATAGITKPLLLLEKEISQYFAGTLSNFNTPLAAHGTSFQKRVWQELQKIPYGSTASYTDIAKALGKPTAYRAVARANSANQLALIIPCHRVISADGSLSGYNGGMARKECLLVHEKQTLFKKRS